VNKKPQKTAGHMVYNRADNLKKRGADANPNGRPKGSVNRTTSIREALKNIALDESGETLEEFCQKIKKNEPLEFFKALIRLEPQALSIGGIDNAPPSQISFAKPTKKEKESITDVEYVTAD
jgi:hypothetical protein